MSPKKVVRAKRKSTEKVRTVHKEKPQLNMPATIKVSIPIKLNTEEGVHTPIVKGRGAPKFKKNLNHETKLELANSVARLQLVKEEPVVFQPDNVVIIQKPRNRRRPKKVKVVSEFFQNRVVMDTAENIDSLTDNKLPGKNAARKKPPTPKNNTAPARRIVTRKRLADSRAQQEDAKRPKIESKTEETPNVQVKLEEKPEDVGVNTVVEPQIVVTQPIAIEQVSQPRPIAKKGRPSMKLTQPTAKKPSPLKQPARKKGRPKGKQDNVASVQSPSILDMLRKQVSDTDVKNKNNHHNAPGLVESRKTSVSSSSTKSWTRDISSSSNNTCVGVCSNDFVRINKKLPVLQLTNVDSELKKLRNKQQKTVEVDESDDLSDPYDSDSSDSERKYSEQLNDSLADVNSLRLSASSPPSSNFSQSRKKDSSPDYAKASDKLSATMEKLDMEIISWIGSDNEDVSANLAKFRDKMFEILDNEFGVITHCRRLKEILEPPKDEDIVDETCISDKVRNCDAKNVTDKALVKQKVAFKEKSPVKERTYVKENSIIKEKSTVKEKTTVKENTITKEKTPVKEKTPLKEKTPVKEQTPVKNNSPVVQKAPVENNVKEFIEPRSRRLSIISNASSKGRDEFSDGPSAGTSYNSYTPYYDHHDDDDALSLFAESISGFESSRFNTSVVSAPPVSKPRQVEEYIPKPVKEDSVNIEKHTYCPTKISEDPETIASKMTSVCEKQNADSTSIYKQSNSTDDTESYQDFNENTDFDTRLGPPDMVLKPRLMSSFFEGMPKARSVVFGNLCFYNLLNCCRKMFFGQCRFVHMIPTSAHIKDKLNLLDQRMFIQEYLLLRKWAELRRRYGMCYVEECAKRGLTRILVEMAYDFIVKAKNDSEEDTRLRVDTIEVTLLHLNTVDLSICEDLLKLPIHAEQGNRILLCDVLMATMSITQNFSRFKRVFLNLTYFMVDNDRTFNKDVVEHILERVCILPFEEPMARALIQMMRLTKSDIFENSMIGHFEKQISVNKDVFEEYSLLKNQCAFTSMLASSMLSASPPLKLDTPTPAPQSETGEPQPPAASPDTTNLDNLNKTAEEPTKPVITRTIGMNPPIIFNRAAQSSEHSRTNPGSSKGHMTSGSPTTDDPVKLNIRKWRNRSIFPHALPPPMANRMHTPTRPQMRPLMPHMRPPQRMPFNQRLVTFKSPTSYGNRQPGPKY